MSQGWCAGTVLLSARKAGPSTKVSEVPTPSDPPQIPTEQVCSSQGRTCDEASIQLGISTPEQMKAMVVPGVFLLPAALHEVHLDPVFNPSANVCSCP